MIEVIITVTACLILMVITTVALTRFCVMNEKQDHGRLMFLLRNAIVAYENELEGHDYDTEEELHDVVLNEVEITEAEYRVLMHPDSYKL